MRRVLSRRTLRLKKKNMKSRWRRRRRDGEAELLCVSDASENIPQLVLVRVVNLTRASPGYST